MGGNYLFVYCLDFLLCKFLMTFSVTLNSIFHTCSFGTLPLNLILKQCFSIQCSGELIVMSTVVFCLELFVAAGCLFQDSLDKKILTLSVTSPGQIKVTYNKTKLSV